MSISAQPQLSAFALSVQQGLSAPRKTLSPRYFYDDIGSALFEAITLLPEYGLTRADQRLLRVHAAEIAVRAGRTATVAELGSGSGKKTRYVLEAVCRGAGPVCYRPIDVSRAALFSCEKELQGICEIRPVCGDWVSGLAEIAQTRDPNQKLLLLFLGSSIGNLDRHEIPKFLRDLRSHLLPGDLFLLGADLIKNVDRMLLAYDDPTGVTAAFNLNLLGRINRELDADFDLKSFRHEARWNERERCVEMHLVCCRRQRVYIAALDAAIHFEAGETIWTESSHKFTRTELEEYAQCSGFQALTAWVDQEWPFAETLWRAR